MTSTPTETNQVPVSTSNNQLNYVLIPIKANNIEPQHLVYQFPIARYYDRAGHQASKLSDAHYVLSIEPLKNDFLVKHHIPQEKLTALFGKQPEDFELISALLTTNPACRKFFHASNSSQRKRHKSLRDNTGSYDARVEFIQQLDMQFVDKLINQDSSQSMVSGLSLIPK